MNKLRDEIKGLTVKQLREHLAQFPDEWEVVYSCCSSWVKMEAHEVGPMKAVDKGGYVDTVYRGNTKDGLLAKMYMAFPGN